MQTSNPPKDKDKKVHPIVRRLKIILQSKLTRIGSILSIATGLTSLLTPIGQSIAPILNAWNAGMQAFSIAHKEPDSKVAVYQTIDPVARKRHMDYILARLKAIDKRVLAIAFYTLYPTDFSGDQLIYQGDTGAIDGGEMFFYDFQTHPDPRTETSPLVLDAAMQKNLLLKNCILVKGAGHLGMTATKDKFNVILCPTIAIEQDKKDPRLTKFVVKNVVALAVPPTVNSIDPFGGWLFDYVPSIENVVTPASPGS